MSVPHPHSNHSKSTCTSPPAPQLTGWPKHEPSKAGLTLWELAGRRTQITFPAWRNQVGLWLPKSCSCCCRDLTKQHIFWRASGGSLTLILTNPPVFMTQSHTLPCQPHDPLCPNTVKNNIFTKELHFHFCTPVSYSESTIPPKEGNTGYFSLPLMLLHFFPNL